MIQKKNNIRNPKDEAARIPFWPTKYQAFGCLGGLLGAIGGPILVFLGVVFLSWLQPTTGAGSGPFLIVELLIAAQLGFAAGVAIGTAIAERTKR